MVPLECVDAGLVLERTRDVILAAQQLRLVAVADLERNGVSIGPMTVCRSSSTAIVT